MKILFDHQAFTMQQYGGVSKCFCELISHFPAKIDWEISIRESSNIHLHESKLLPELSYSRIDQNNFITTKTFRGKGRLYKMLNRWFSNFPSADNINYQYSINQLKNGNFDIFHPTFFDDYFLPYLNGKPFVLTIHDMIPELFPEYFKCDDFQIVKKRELVKKAAAIIAVSEQTKKDVMRLLNVPDNKIFVIYHGGPELQKKKYKNSIIDSPYFLYVGGRGAYKNFPMLLTAFAKFVSYNPEVKLVCTGSCFSKQEKRLINSLNLNKSIIQMFANDTILSILYSHAIAFIYPSLYEGFGMPILEAYAHDCPVILSHCSCFPEIAGNAATYFNVNNSLSDLADKLQQLFCMTSDERKLLISAGRERLTHYSWEQSAKKLAAVYSSLE